MTNTRKMVRLSMFLAVSVLLHYLETLIPIPFLFPGVKLGLANIVTLVVLYFYSPKEFFFIGFLRVFLGGLFSGLGTSFWISFSGWLLSSLTTILLYYVSKVSIFGLSITSAMAHGVGQIMVVMLIYNTIGMINYLPILLVTGIVTGTITATVAAASLSRMDHMF